MALIETHNIVIEATPPTFDPAAAGDTATVSDKHFLIVRNAAGSSMTVTVAVPGKTVNDIDTPDTVRTVPATNGEVWIPLDSYYADPVDHKAHITYSSLTSVTRAVVKR
jgi:hypothetical protein